MTDEMSILYFKSIQKATKISNKLIVYLEFGPGKEQFLYLIEELPTPHIQLVRAVKHITQLFSTKKKVTKKERS